MKMRTNANERGGETGASRALSMPPSSSSSTLRLMIKLALPPADAYLAGAGAHNISRPTQKRAKEETREVQLTSEQIIRTNLNKPACIFPVIPV